MPYMYPDLNAARALADAGAACIMPLGSPIGSNKGLSTKDFIQILIDEIDLPIIVDAGIGRPSQACEAMEMGASACLVNTAIAVSGNPIEMARAFKLAVEAQLQEMFLPWQKLSKKPLKPDAVLIFPDWDAPSKEAQAHPHL